jgi:hypothetical protein
MPHCANAYVSMQIADVKDSEVLKCRGQVSESCAVFFDNYMVRVSTRASIKSRQFQRSIDDPWRERPILWIEMG